MSKHRVIYSSLEVMTRELPARILLALVAAKRGYVSVIGHKIDVISNLHIFPQGMFWHKSLTKVCKKYYEGARRIGHTNIGCCEETLNIADTPEAEALIGNTLFPETLNLIDHYLACNNAEVTFAKPHLRGGFHETGNVRFDIARPEFFEMFATEAMAIRKRYGNFVLLNSSIFYLHSYRDIEEEINVGAALSETREFILGLRDGERLVRDRMLELCRRIPKETGLSVVLRPHPHENRDCWNDLLAGENGVHIDSSVVLPPFLMAASAVLHGHCTTGVEALIQGRQGFNFAPAPNPYYLINLLNPPVGVEEIISCLAENRSLQPREPLSNHIFGVEGKLAVERMLDVFDSVNTPEWDLSEILGRPFVLRDPEDMDGSMRNRWPTLEIATVNEIIKSFIPMSRRLSFCNVGIKKLTHNMVAIYPA